MTGEAPRRRGRRRAVHPGTGAAARQGPEGGDAPVLPRSPDESDVGWGEPVPDDEERLRREVPPHWGRD